MGVIRMDEIKILDEKTVELHAINIDQLHKDEMHWSLKCNKNGTYAACKRIFSCSIKARTSFYIWNFLLQCMSFTFDTLGSECTNKMLLLLYCCKCLFPFSFSFLNVILISPSQVLRWFECFLLKSFISCNLKVNKINRVSKQSIQSKRIQGLFGVAYKNMSSMKHLNRYRIYG